MTTHHLTPNIYDAMLALADEDKRVRNHRDFVHRWLNPVHRLVQTYGAEPVEYAIEQTLRRRLKNTCVEYVEAVCANRGEHDNRTDSVAPFGLPPYVEAEETRIVLAPSTGAVVGVFVKVADDRTEALKQLPSPKHRLIAAAAWTHKDANKGITDAELAALAGTSTKTVQRTRRELERIGLESWPTRRGRPTKSAAPSSTPRRDAAEATLAAMKATAPKPTPQERSRRYRARRNGEVLA